MRRIDYWYLVAVCYAVPVGTLLTIVFLIWMGPRVRRLISDIIYVSDRALDWAADKVFGSKGHLNKFYIGYYDSGGKMCEVDRLEFNDYKSAKDKLESVYQDSRATHNPTTYYIFSKEPLHD